MKSWYSAICLLLLASCRSEDAAHASPASKGEEITFIVHGSAHPGELKGDHFFQFVVRGSDHREKTIRIPTMDQSTTDAVCATVGAGFEYRGVSPLERTSSVRDRPRGPEPAASLVLPPPGHVESVTVERRDREGAELVRDMTQVEVRRDGYPMPNTQPPTVALPATGSK
jgi:hypothetical protein